MAGSAWAQAVFCDIADVSAATASVALNHIDRLRLVNMLLSFRAQFRGRIAFLIAALRPAAPRVAEH
jgi:hypothetical protein